MARTCTELVEQVWLAIHMGSLAKFCSCITNRANHEDMKVKDSDATWDIGRLKIFARVAEEGSLSRAAIAIGMPQPAISRQIAKLEQECGGRLFLRTGRGVTLSDLGIRLLPYAQSILREARGLALEVLANSDKPGGHVNLGVLPSLYSSLVVPLFVAIREKYPDIKLRVFEGSAGQIDPWLSSGHVDVGITYRYGHKLQPDVDALVSVDSFLVGAKGDTLTKRAGVPFKLLDGIPLVLPGAPSAVRGVLEQIAKKVGISLNIVLEADSNQIQKAVVMETRAYSILPIHSVMKEINEGLLQASPVVDPSCERTLAMGITSSRPASQATRVVAAAIRQIMTKADAKRLF